ncbi:hypothetical protein PCANC_19392 [Puccinia coronata f. sp. avenae]|nr:hypothetical protein PCANC_19392 [Puccinia coronata f. sp. avenae]
MKIISLGIPSALGPHAPSQSLASNSKSLTQSSALNHPSRPHPPLHPPSAIPQHLALRSTSRKLTQLLGLS